MGTHRRAVLAGAILLGLQGATAPPAAGEEGEEPFAAARERCVAAINGWREQAGVPPLERWSVAEACADHHARYDAANGVHAGFRARICEPEPLAENECPGRYYTSLEGIFAECLPAMAAEGPGGAHFENLTRRDYRRVACGFYRTAQGELWAVQMFR